MTLTVDDAVADLPPSAKLVHCILRAEDGLRHAEIRERGHLAKGTTTNALYYLLEADIVERRADMDDHRRSYYYLCDRD